MKVRRKSVRTSKAQGNSRPLLRKSAFKKAPRRSLKASKRVARKVPKRAAMEVVRNAKSKVARRSSRVVRVIRENPGKALIILGMVAMVSIVTIVVLVLPPPPLII